MMALLKYHTRFHKLTVIFFMCSQIRFYLSLFSVYDFFFWIYMHHINAWYPQEDRRSCLVPWNWNLRGS